MSSITLPEVGRPLQRIVQQLCFMQPSLWYSGSDVTYWAWRQMDSIMQWEGGNTSGGLLFTACPHIHTYHQHDHHLCSKPETVCTSSIYTLRSTDGFVVVHLAVSTILGSCRAIGFHSVSFEITHGGKKKKITEVQRGFRCQQTY